MKSVFTIVCAAAFTFTSTAQSVKLPKGAIGRLELNVSALANDFMEGRGTGTAGELKAGEFIARDFQRFKLEPKGDSSWYQPFTFVIAFALIWIIFTVPITYIGIYYGFTSNTVSPPCKVNAFRRQIIN